MVSRSLPCLLISLAHVVTWEKHALDLPQDLILDWEGEVVRLSPPPSSPPSSPPPPSPPPPPLTSRAYELRGSQQDVQRVREAADPETAYLRLRQQLAARAWQNLTWLQVLYRPGDPSEFDPHDLQAELARATTECVQQFGHAAPWKALRRRKVPQLPRGNVLPPPTFVRKPLCFQLPPMSVVTTKPVFMPSNEQFACYSACHTRCRHKDVHNNITCDSKCGGRCRHQKDADRNLTAHAAALLQEFGLRARVQRMASRRYTLPALGVIRGLNAMLKPFTRAFIAGEVFASPLVTSTRGISGRLTSLELRSLEPSMCYPGPGPGEVPGPGTYPVVTDVPLLHNNGAEEDQEAPLPEKWSSRGGFWWAAQAQAWLLRPDASLQGSIDSLKRSLGWSELRPVLALHVRTADASLCSRRSCALDAYLRSAFRSGVLRFYGYRSLFVASADGSALADARALDKQLRAASQTSAVAGRLHAAGVRRVLTAPPPMDGSNASVPSGGALTPTRHVLRELFLLADADGLVGKASSAFFRTALELGVGRSQCAVPFISLDVPWSSNGMFRNGTSTADGGGTR
jgi:hypothetical protein